MEPLRHNRNLNMAQFEQRTRDWQPADELGVDRFGGRGGADPEEMRDRVFREKTRDLSKSKGIPSKWGWQDHGDPEELMATRKKVTRQTTRAPQPTRNQLFHGSATEIQGGEVLPPMYSGASQRNIPVQQAHWLKGPRPPRPEGMQAHEVAHATERERVAWDFAEMSARPDRGGGRSRVYELGRNENMRMGVEHHLHPDYDLHHRGGTNREWVAESFPIASRRDIQPPERWEPLGRQGTLPIDWSRMEKVRPARTVMTAGMRGPEPYDVPAKAFPMGDSYGNHPTYQSHNREREAVRMQEKRKAEAEVEAVAREKAPRRGRQMLLPGMRGVGR